MIGLYKVRSCLTICDPSLAVSLRIDVKDFVLLSSNCIQKKRQQFTNVFKAKEWFFKTMKIRIWLIYLVLTKENFCWSDCYLVGFWLFLHISHGVFGPIFKFFWYDSIKIFVPIVLSIQYTIYFDRFKSSYKIGFVFIFSNKSILDFYKYSLNLLVRIPIHDFVMFR